MEGSLPPSGMIQGSPYGMLDLQNPMHMHTQSFNHHPNQNQANTQHQCSLTHARQINDYFLQPINSTAELSMMAKNSNSDEDDLCLTNDDEHGNHSDCPKGKQGWHRMKWTDQMVRLLVTAVSYVGEDTECNTAGRKKLALQQKKGKWKAISKVLAERGCFVSPQQCEDKFNDLNKRYKRLTDLLGRGTTCKVVENPALLDMMDISDKAKEDARKILSSKQLFYEEMCSYHNGNRFNLPPDPALQRALQLALRSRDEHDNCSKKELQEDDHDDEEEIDSDDDHVNHGVGKRAKMGNEIVGFSIDMNRFKAEELKVEFVDKEYVASRRMQLEEQRLQIEAERLELKNQKFKWMRFSQKKDRELEKMRLDNKRMKLENERLNLELRLNEAEFNLN